VEWDTDNLVVITLPKGTRVFKQETQVGTVKVEYRAK
jgi:hypothetical protein